MSLQDPVSSLHRRLLTTESPRFDNHFNLVWPILTLKNLLSSEVLSWKRCDLLIEYQGYFHQDADESLESGHFRKPTARLLLEVMLSVLLSLMNRSSSQSPKT